MKERFLVTPSGYKFDKRLFRGVALMLVLIAAAAVLVYGWGNDNIYYRCPADSVGYCENPFLDEFGFCAIENGFLCSVNRFAPGFEYGEPPAWVLSNFGVLFLAILVLAFVLNHYTNNKRFAR